MTSPTELVEDHLSLVESVVAKLASRFPRHVDRTELMSAGMLGLVEAAARYEPERGVPFGPYAQRRISGAVLDSCRASDWAPRSVRASARRADAAEQSIASKLGRAPTPRELSSAMGITIDELHRLRELVQRGQMESIDADPTHSVASRPGVHDMQRGDPARALEMVEQLAYLRDAISVLPERHRTVIVGSYFDDHPDKTIADMLDVSLSRVSQLRADALQMIKDGMNAQYVQESPPEPKGRVEQRKARYAASIAAASSHRSRVSTALAC
jgi:RNA polymerase sigma factor for flagellar operon FliA